VSKHNQEAEKMRPFAQVLVIAGLSLSMFAAESPFTGTWKLKPSNGDAGNSIAKVRADSQHITLEQRFVDDKGQSHTVTCDAKFDGKDYSVSGSEEFDSVSVKRVNDKRIIATWKKSGKRVGTSDVRVSQDGNSQTVDFTSYRGKSPEKSTDIYEKQ